MDQNIIPSPTTIPSSRTIFSKTSSSLSKNENLLSSTIVEHEFIPTQNNNFSKVPWNQNSHAGKSSWPNNFNEINYNNIPQCVTILGSIEDGHIYSLAAKSDVLYTGTESKKIRVWKNMHEFSALKSRSGLVKSIIISGDKIFTGHQDGKVRVWKTSQEYPSVHKRSGTLPKFTDILKSSIRPKNYVEVKRNRTDLWIKHCDAISSLSICEEHGLLYSASWDRTIKVWRIENSKCLESINAHDDAVNSVVSSVQGIVYSGSADGTLKVWKRESVGKSVTVKHVFVRKLLSQDSAVTSLAVNNSGSFVYCGLSKGVVYFWDIWNLHRGVLDGHTLAVLCLSATGNLVFSGSTDRNICVWRRDGIVHSCLGVLRGHDGPVKCLAVEEKHSKGKEGHFVVYSGSVDKSVRVWSVCCGLQEMEIDQKSRGVGNAGWGKLPSSMN